MRGEAEKGRVELKVFFEFAEKALLDLVPCSARKGDPNLGEPDICCELGSGPMFYELAEACAPEFAMAISKAVKTGDSQFVRGDDATVATLIKKLSKNYDVSHPIELILYTNGRAGLPDDVIAAQLIHFLSSGYGPFERVWLLGDELQLLTC